MIDHEVMGDWKLDPELQRRIEEMGKVLQDLKVRSFRDDVRHALRVAWKKIVEIFRLW